MDASNLLIIGNVNADLIIGPMDQWPEIDTETVFSMSDMRPGGSAGNTALTLRELGTPCQLISAVGNDHIGSWLQEEYGEAAVGWPPIEGPTTISVGVVHTTGERTFLTTPGHLEKFNTSHIMASLDNLPKGGGIAMLSGVFLSPPLMDGYGDLFSRLRERGYELAIDPGWPCYGWSKDLADELLGWFSQCDHILINDKEATALAKEPTVEAATATLARMLPKHCKLIIKTGKDGAFVRTSETCFSMSAPEVTPFDTIGAGDCFNGGYLHGLANGHDLRRAVQFGVLTASKAVSTFPREYPSVQDLERFMKSA